MPAAMHSFYLRNMYQENLLVKPGGITLDGVPIDLRQIKTPSFLLSTREDHIAPPKSVLLGSSLFGGPVKYVLAGSGHIAGVVNPPDKNKYQYWTGAKPQGDDVDKWLADAAASLDPEVRKDLYSKVQLKVLDDAVTIPLADSITYNAKSAKLQGDFLDYLASYVWMNDAHFEG